MKKGIRLFGKEFQFNVGLLRTTRRTTRLHKGWKYRLRRRDFIGYQRLAWNSDRCVDHVIKAWPLRVTVLQMGYGTGEHRGLD